MIIGILWWSLVALIFLAAYFVISCLEIGRLILSKLGVKQLYEFQRQESKIPTCQGCL